MSKYLIRAAVIGAAIALLAAASALAKPEVARVGNLILHDNGGITPTKLPRHEQAPVAAHINGKISTVDGSHPPALKAVIADFDKNIKVNAKGLPACKLNQLQARDTKTAEKACPDAIVGSGEAEVAVSFPEQAPFGATVLYIHAYVSVPAPTAVVATVKVSKINRGHFGQHATVDVPVIAGGAGSVTKFRLKVDRKFTYRGKKQSYLTASCPTGVYYAEGIVEFTDGPTLEVSHILPCAPKD
ncbi:MAG TPA: hypothetical protein VFI03_06655 [Solirubrobacterales bacterium]|nr:hypothetical protein [Solirubrobacterales bacterium]